MPLETELLVTTAVRLPTLGCFASAKVTINSVEVAVVTDPSAPLLNTTVLLVATGSNPNPAIVIVASLAASEAEEDVITGATLAT